MTECTKKQLFLITLKKQLKEYSNITTSGNNVNYCLLLCIFIMNMMYEGATKSVNSHEKRMSLARYKFECIYM